MSQHLRLPVRIGPDGTFRTVSEDSVDEITQNVLVILRTRTDERLATPGFGTPDPTFVGFDAATVLEQVADVDPRADLSVVRQALDALGREQVDLAVRRSGSGDPMPTAELGERVGPVRPPRGTYTDTYAGSY